MNIHFVCQVGDHCQNGQRVTVYVLPRRATTTTHKTGPRGGKIKSTVYRDWVEANGGKWVGFQWKLLE